MFNFIRRLITKNVDYSTRHHMHARFQSTDFRFLGAVAAFGIVLLLVLRYA